MLSSASLAGSIPTTFGQLQTMFTLNLMDNFLSGALPSELGLIPFVGNPSIASFTEMIKNMTGWDGGQLALSSNNFSGTIPTELGGEFNDIKILALDGNPSLRGPIPSEVGRLWNLEILQLNNCNLSSSIPTHIGRLHLVENLLLNQNQLEGSLPSELGLLTNMAIFDASGNALTGNIPSESGRLIETHLTSFNVSGNEALAGKVPGGLCVLNSMLDFDCNGSLCGCYCVCAMVPSNEIGF